MVDCDAAGRYEDCGMNADRVMHTPTQEPWLLTGTTVYALNDGGTNRFSASVQQGFIDSGSERTSLEELEANARLIAAAPLLLQELRGANTQMEMAAECIEAGRYDEALLHVCSMSRKRLAAIAEATGEQP
jgi:hypothetical protein